MRTFPNTVNHKGSEIEKNRSKISKRLVHIQTVQSFYGHRIRKMTHFEFRICVINLGIYNYYHSTHKSWSRRFAPSPIACGLIVGNNVSCEEFVNRVGGITLSLGRTCAISILIPFFKTNRTSTSWWPIRDRANSHWSRDLNMTNWFHMWFSSPYALWSGQLDALFRDWTPAEKDRFSPEYDSTHRANASR